MMFLNKMPWRRVPLVYQTESSTCGLACLSMVMQYHGKAVTITAIQERFPVSLKGITLKQIVNIGNEYQLSCRPLKCDVDSLSSLQLPAILHWDFNHFVVLRSIGKKDCVIHDPAVGVRRISLEEFARHFTGIAVEVQPGTEFQLKSEGSRLGLRWLFSNTKALRPLLIQTMWLTLLIEVLALSTPLFIKYAIDYGIQLADIHFLKLLAGCFVGIAIVHSILAYVRDYAGIYLGSKFNQFFLRSLFSHLLSLPLSYFEKRNIGALIEKYYSTDQLRTLLTSNFVSVVLDGALALGMALAIFIISPLLCAITIGSFLFYFAFRWYCSKNTELKLKEKIKAKEKETGTVIETLRSISPIKIFAKEDDKLSIWQNKYSALMTAEVAFARFVHMQSAVRIVVVGIDIALCMLVAGALILEGRIGIGTLFALFMFKAQFSLKSHALITSLLDMKYVSIYLDRLADIILASAEKSSPAASGALAQVRGDLRLRDVTFSYAIADKPLFTNLNMTIKSGEFVALIGPSGSGKSTLLKLILGLYQPNQGCIELDDHQIQQFDPAWYRRQLGVVMQDDRLFSVSVVDNISFEDPWADFERVQQAAVLANIHDEIMAMPMKYNTLIGDLGSTLSGGQKQRILLARALYHQPKILLADEGTANLDSDNERTVLDQLSRLPMTRFCIAHRPETLLRADRVLLLKDGVIREISKSYALSLHERKEVECA